MNPEYMEALRLVTDWVKAQQLEYAFPPEQDNAEVLGALNKLYLCVTDDEAVSQLERIQDYAYAIMHNLVEGQDELDPAWVWRVAHDAIYPCTCNHSTWGRAHDFTCPRFSDEYKVR